VFDVGFEERADNHRAGGLAAARRTADPVSVAMFDLNGFKDFNDAHGHPAGDALLASIAEDWNGRLRPRDVLARVGGDEFALLRPGTGIAGAMSVASDLCESVGQGAVTCSAGVAIWDGVESLDDVLAGADGVLYEAKRAGSAYPMVREGSSQVC
jgi:diguanylate cyclase (GGDEF)-like protein